MNLVDIQNHQRVMSPGNVLSQYPLSSQRARSIAEGRAQAASIIQGLDDRLLCVVGPCSIHDVNSAFEYAERLSKVAALYAQDLLLVMRTYFEKPRSSLGWQGFINDTNLDGSHSLMQGLIEARKLLLAIDRMNLKCACEFLNPFTPHYLSDCLTWTAVGARNVSAQTSRHLSSGYAMPVGFKNPLSGDYQVAIDAMISAQSPQTFLSSGQEGRTEVCHTQGNPNTHLILRGGSQGTNYHAHDIEKAWHDVRRGQLGSGIMIDCSHGNSGKNHEQQKRVCQSIAQQVAAGQTKVIGVMLESHLVAGAQSLTESKALKYGQSITDPCLGWDDTLQLLDQLSRAVQKRREQV